ncbi:hypothetical protein HRbin39_00763 [bacterium HR39]|nr:hypothetical protein HRbin39_00763 [bacterium HR39]
MAQQRLGREDDQGFTEVTVQLPPQHVEEVGRSRAVADLHVVLGVELQEALDARRAVLRPLPLVAVRQQAHQPRHAQPLALAGADELVEVDLSAVGEVAELRLPDGEAVGIGDGVAVLEPQHALLREHAVDDLHRRLVGCEMREGDVPLLGGLVDDDGVALGEGAAAHVLAREAHGEALHQQGGEGEVLGRGPVDPLARLDGPAPLGDDAAKARVHVEPLGQLRHLQPELAQPLDRHRGGAAHVAGRGGAKTPPVALQPVRLVGAIAARGLVGGLQFAHAGVPHGLRLARRDHPLLLEPPREDLPHRGVLGDLLVHERLGEARFVALVVAVTPVAPQVDDHVLLELPAVLGGELGHLHHRHRIVAVDVEHRRLDAPRHVGGIGRAAGVGRARGEADLVVDDDVDGAADPIAPQLGHLEALVHHALADEGGIAVDQQRPHPLALRIAAQPLLGAGLAHHHRIDRLEVRGIGREREVHPPPAGHGAVGGGAEVVLDVARAQHLVHHRLALELGEDGGVRFAHHVGQHVEPAAMGHADHHLLGTEIRGGADHRLDRGDGGLAAVDAEALGAGELAVQEGLEGLGPGELQQDLALFLGRGVEDAAGALDGALDPGLLVRILDVHELHTHRAAVGAVEHLHDLAQRRLLEAEDVIEVEFTVPVGLGEAVGARIQLGVVGAAGEPQRIEVGDQVSAHAIGADHHDQPQVIADERPGVRIVDAQAHRAEDA